MVVSFRKNKGMPLFGTFLPFRALQHGFCEMLKINEVAQEDQ